MRCPNCLVRSLLACLALLLPAGMTATGAPVATGPSPAALAGAIPAAATSASLGMSVLPASPEAALDRLPLYFVPNRGQLPAEVAYSVLGGGTGVYFTRSGLTFILGGSLAGMGAGARSLGLSRQSLFGAGFQSPAQPGWSTLRRLGAGFPGSAAPGDLPAGWAVRLEFVGANPQARLESRGETGAVVSYFKGPQPAWRTGLPTYAEVAYANLWPGIDLVYRGTAGRLKYEFLVKPGADPGQIRLAYSGVSALQVDASGRLAARTPRGTLIDEAPLAWQEGNGGRSTVDVSYRLGAADGAAEEYGFQVDAYDRSRALVLDPVVLAYCGYIGGSDRDQGNAIALDSKGNAFVAGSTSSTQGTFPITGGPALDYGGSEDAFVAKVNAGGTALLYAGYIGGSNTDQARGIAVDSAGNAYITGETWSNEGTFPVTVGPDLTFNGGNTDAFVAKVNAAGTALLYAGYIGGSCDEGGAGIAVDAVGDAYVTGATCSSEASFPVAFGPALKYKGGGDAFVAQVNATGTKLIYAGYIGGSASDYGAAIAVDAADNAYITGSTSSDETTFPRSVGPDLTYNGGNADAFVAKVNPSGTFLFYAGYIGGSGQQGDEGTGIAVDAAGDAYVTGVTFSSEASFPVTVGPDLTFNGISDFSDAFVAKVDPTGGFLQYCGYIGGSFDDVAHGIAVDSAGNAYITGETNSYDGTFPVTVGPDTTHNGGHDAFVAKVNAAGTALLYAGYIGGSGEDGGTSIAVDAGGHAYVTGYTQSSEASFPVRVGPDLSFNDSSAYLSDAFVAKVNVLYPMYLPVLRGAMPAPVLTAIIAPDSQPRYAVSWSAVAGASSYVLQEATDAAFATAQQIYAGPGTSLQVDSRGIQRYYYRVKAQAGSVISGWSNIQFVDVRWELEPNNTSTTANGPLASGRAYYGRPNDGNDVFWFDSAGGHIVLDLTNYTATQTQLLLYYGTGAPAVAQAYKAPYHIDYTGPAGHYYVLVYATSGYNSTTVYTLQAGFP